MITYWVAVAEQLEEIFSLGLLSAEGLCGRGIYFFDDVEAASNAADVFHDEDGVVIKVDLETQVLNRCDEADVESEGDRDYYSHVEVLPMPAGQRFWPRGMRVIFPVQKVINPFTGELLRIEPRSMGTLARPSGLEWGKL